LLDDDPELATLAPVDFDAFVHDDDPELATLAPVDFDDFVLDDDPEIATLAPVDFDSFVFDGDLEIATLAPVDFDAFVFDGDLEIATLAPVDFGALVLDDNPELATLVPVDFVGSCSEILTFPGFACTVSAKEPGDAGVLFFRLSSRWRGSFWVLSECFFDSFVIQSSDRRPSSSSSREAALATKMA